MSTTRTRIAAAISCLAALTAGLTVCSSADAAPPCVQPDALFCSDFEESDLDDNWGLDVTNRAQIIEAPGPAGQPGNHVAQLRVPAGRGGIGFYKVLSAGQDRLYARWYQRWEPGYDFNAGCHNFTYYAGTNADPTSCMGCSDNRPNGDDWFSAWLEPCGTDRRLHFYAYYRGMYMDCSNPVGSCWGDHFPCMLSDNYCSKPEYKPQPGKTPPQVDAGTWYCLETLVDAGTATSDSAQADGVLDFWIDGVQYGPFNDLWLRTSPNVLPTVFWLGLFHHEDHSVEGIQVDETVVSTAPIGCLAAGAAGASGAGGSGGIGAGGGGGSNAAGSSGAPGSGGQPSTGGSGGSINPGDGGPSGTAYPPPEDDSSSCACSAPGRSNSPLSVLHTLRVRL